MLIAVAITPGARNQILRIGHSGCQGELVWAKRVKFGYFTVQFEGVLAMTNTSLQCPRCHRVDNVQKVSAIVNAGISSSTYTGYADGIGYTPNGPAITDDYITIAGSSQTALSSLLAPPQRPTYNTISGIISTPAGLHASVWLLVIGLAGALIILSSLQNFELLFSASGILGIICFAIPIWLLSRMIRNANASRIWAETQMPHWQRAITKWQQLFYCHRCDGVFLPGHFFFVPAGQMLDFLYG